MPTHGKHHTHNNGRREHHRRAIERLAKAFCKILSDANQENQEGQKMKAILRTYDHRDASYTDRMVEIDDSHDFGRGPYQDSVPFAVGSNQTILELEEGDPERMED